MDEGGDLSPLLADEVHLKCWFSTGLPRMREMWAYWSVFSEDDKGVGTFVLWEKIEIWFGSP